MELEEGETGNLRKRPTGRSNECAATNGKSKPPRTTNKVGPVMGPKRQAHPTTRPTRTRNASPRGRWAGSQGLCSPSRQRPQDPRGVGRKSLISPFCAKRREANLVGDLAAALAYAGQESLTAERGEERRRERDHGSTGRQAAAASARHRGTMGSHPRPRSCRSSDPGNGRRSAGERRMPPQDETS